MAAAINDWPGGKAAARLRQWPRVLELADAAASAQFVGVTLLGSFAGGEGDDVSDVDFIVFAADERSGGRGTSAIGSIHGMQSAGTTHALPVPAT